MLCKSSSVSSDKSSKFHLLFSVNISVALLQSICGDLFGGDARLGSKSPHGKYRSGLLAYSQQERPFYTEHIFYKWCGGGGYSWLIMWFVHPLTKVTARL